MYDIWNNICSIKTLSLIIFDLYTFVFLFSIILSLYILSIVIVIRLIECQILNNSFHSTKINLVILAWLLYFFKQNKLNCLRVMHWTLISNILILSSIYYVFVVQIEIFNRLINLSHFFSWNFLKLFVNQKSFAQMLSFSLKSDKFKIDSCDFVFSIFVVLTFWINKTSSQTSFLFISTFISFAIAW